MSHVAKAVLGVIQRTSACFMPTGSLRYRGKGGKHGKSSTHVDVRQGGGAPGRSAAGTDLMIRRTTSYVRHTISYVTPRCRRLNINRIKYTISYITYDIVCQQTVPTTSYAICTYDIVYDMNLQTYDVVCFLGHTISYTTCIFWDIRYRTSYLRCRM